MAASMSQLSEREVARFLEDEVKPKSSDMEKINKEVDQFVRFLHEYSEAPFTVDRVVKGGSLGKGTSVRGMADIDLEVVYNGITSIEDLEKKRNRILNAIEKAVKKKTDWKGHIEKTNRTTFSIQFLLNGIELDVLPVFDAEKHVGSPSKIYADMENFAEGVEKAAKQYSASLSELQIAFVKRVDAKIKDVIRLLKSWKKSEKLDLRSYSVELLVLHEGRNQPTRTIYQLLRRCMGRLACCHTICIAFDANYNSTQYTKGLTGPFILDPANPHMNTLEGTNIKAVVRAANKYFRDFYMKYPGQSRHKKKKHSKKKRQATK